MPRSIHKPQEAPTEAPILAYPDFSRDFVLETDALGLGAVLSHEKEDGKLRLIVYASRSLPTQEKNYKNYGVTDMETPAVTWAVSHFHYYFYGHNANLYTDHSAVKTILQTSNANSKHARWWSKVFSSGIGCVEIVYWPGKDNLAADALSRNPLQKCCR